jgi:two-component system phosphate regulon response regulator PhoB
MQGTVLIVDGDAEVRNVLAGNFALAGYRTTRAGTLAEAQDVVRRTKPDIALLEWNGLSPGLLFVRQLRCNRRTADATVIVVGARAGEQERITALESGADDFVAKPFSVRELLARVRAVQRRRAPQLGDDVVEVAGLSVDPAAQRVRAGEHEIRLRKNEFDLLHFFITHAQRTLTRSKLLDEIWGDDVFVGERTVDVHVRRLRRALAPSGHGALIETVRGVGYRFRSEPGTPTLPASSYFSVAAATEFDDARATLPLGAHAA